MKSCIVSLATKNSRYVDGLARLSNSLRDNANGIDFLGFIHEHSVGAPLHTDNNYAFKVYAIQKAIDAGYTKILWLDSSVFAIAPVQPIFDIINKNGYWFEGAGCYLGDWCNDKALNYYGISRDLAKNIQLIQGGFMGFDIESKVGLSLFQNLSRALSEGLFNGSWSDHRHDQSCMSAIIHVFRNEFELSFSHQPEFVQYGGVYDKVLNENIIFKCQGI